MSGKNSNIESASPVGIDSKKINTARRILDVFTGQSCFMAQIPSPPFADNHGPNDLFEPSLAAGEEVNFESILKDAASEFSLELSPASLADSDKQLSVESQTVLGDWEYSLTVMKRLSELYRTIDPKTHFENFLFPKEDYAEYVRTRAKLIGPIRLILDQLRNVKSALDENVARSGNLDLPKAIQVIATGSNDTDVFGREENETKSEAWAILIDSSKSLETFARDVQEIAVCLAEVAKDLIPSHNSWACYSFNENLYIVKDFSEIYGMRTKSRIGGLDSGLKTYLPDALRLAANRIKNTTEEIKVLLVASDGFPLGYEGIDEELVETIEQINKAGIQLIGMGVGSSSIKKYFRSNCQVSSPFDLMKQFVKIYIELSTSF
jgi:nitric oxide reductase activation protein